MRDDTVRIDPVRVAGTVLTLIGTPRHRELVHRLCRAHAPADSVIDVASATDAVMTLLARPVDVVLVDATLAGDLLGALTRHARRSAPNAKFAIFGNVVPHAAHGSVVPLVAVLPWSQLESTLHGFLHAG